MRALLLVLAVLTVPGCSRAAPGADPSPDAPVVEARMPLEILRDAGQPPRMGQVALEAGGYGEDHPYSVSFNFESDGVTLGAPEGVGLSVRFGAYCRDRPSRVEAVLIAPSGQRWRAHRVYVPAGPDRGQDWSSGYLDTPEVLEAVAGGGRFTVALQDDEGQLWNEVVIDTFTAARREEMFAANREALRGADPAMPVKGEPMLSVVRLPPPVLPSPPRPCP